MECLVSVIVPVYNCEKYLEKCLRSIVRQSYVHLEVLVINDGSTDVSQRIINLFAQSDPRVHSLCQQNQGVAAARNHALRFARGDYYLFVDGDDYLGINYVKTMVECANANHSELVISGYTLVRHNKISTVIPGIYVKNDREEWAYRICSAGFRLYRSEFWKRHRLYFVQEDNARAEDIPPALFANAMASNVCVCGIAEYYYVQHELSAMHNKNAFLFPYFAFANVYYDLRNRDLVNSREFFDIGVLKFLAYFEFVLYRKAGRVERHRFYTYVDALLKEDIQGMRQEWKKRKKNVRFSLRQKLAISLFLVKVCARRKR